MFGSSQAAASQHNARESTPNRHAPIAPPHMAPAAVICPPRQAHQPFLSTASMHSSKSTPWSISGCQPVAMHSSHHARSAVHAQTAASCSQGPHAPNYVEDEAAYLQELEFAEAEAHAKLSRLRSMRPFVIDNSMRETMVAAVRGHTLEDKLAILQLIRGAGPEHFILASFAQHEQVDDQLLQYLNANGMRPWVSLHGVAFSELRDRLQDGLPCMDVPLGLIRMQQYGIRQAIIEVDFADPFTDWSRLSDASLLALIVQRCAWVQQHLSLPGQPAAAYINMRDLPAAMRAVPQRVLHVVAGLALLPPGQRPMGLLFEDAEGSAFPHEAGEWVAAVRQAMDAHGWPAGLLLAHVHQNYGLAEAVVMECLACGADGIWSAICNEGAATGHAGYLRTLANLAQLGNTHVSVSYDLEHMRDAAVQITYLLTGEDPHPFMEVYGSMAPPISSLLQPRP